jgi:hypothetical protein
MPVTAAARPLPPIAVHWVKNNILAALISGGGSLVFYGVWKGTGAADADVGFAVIVVVYVAWVALAAFSGAVNGILVGAVLQRILPLLPARTWIALQVGIGVVIGIATGMSLMAPPRDPTSTPDASMLATLMGGLILGAILGAGIGALEALVLRKAALGTGTWITYSTISYAVALAFFAGSSKVFEVGSNFGGEFTSQVLFLMAAVIAALVMLPALRQLRSLLSAAPQYFT